MRRRHRLLALLAGAASLVSVAACTGVDSGVSVEAAGSSGPATTPVVVTVTTTAAPATTPPPATEPATTPAPTEAPTTAPPACLPTLPDLPALVVSSGTEVALVEAGARRVVTTVDPAPFVAYADGLGGVVAEVHTGESRSDIVQFGPSGSSRIDLGANGSVLYEVASVGGQPVLLGAALPGPEFEDPNAVVTALNLSTGVDTTLGPAFGPEYGTSKASYGGGVVALTASADLTESISYVGIDGGPAPTLYSPTATLPYNEPPFISNGALSPDGGRLAWIAGPDASGAEPNVRVGDWQLLIATSDTGTVQAQVRIGGQEIAVFWLDYDGRFVVLSVGASTGGVADQEVVVVDTSAASPVPVKLCGVTGIATIARFPVA